MFLSKKLFLVLLVVFFILEQSLAEVHLVSFRQSAVAKTGDREIQQAIAKAERGKGVLVLTDVGGASPCNCVTRLLCSDQVAVVSGLNLAMLLRVWNYRSKPLGQLVKLALEGGIRDIKECSQ